jgi:nucleotide-binding universal stress UspA family protein
VTAVGGRNAVADRVELPDEVDPRTPVEALVDASRSADLVVVGSRGATGLAALGSVAERVSHQADCPVLIVRGRT